MDWILSVARVPDCGWRHYELELAYGTATIQSGRGNHLSS
jgi:hypothetical protein